jgi:hypothetical protein
MMLFLRRIVLAEFVEETRLDGDYEFVERSVECVSTIISALEMSLRRAHSN